MKLRFNTLAVSVVALSALAASAAPTAAGDWNNGDGSLKEARGRAAVAVPAPMPIAESGPGWYLRGGLGYSVKQTGDINSSGYDVGLYRSFDDLGGSPSFGAGFGAYINNNVRWDLTGDLRPSQRVSRNGTNNYNLTTVAPNSGTVSVLGSQTLNGVATAVTLTAATSAFHTYDIARAEDARTANQTFLANVYYEPISRGLFKPYIGAGAGFAINTIKRKYSETGVCSGTETRWVDPFTNTTDTRAEVTCLAPKTTTSATGTSAETGFGLAGALMAGVGYEIKDGVTLDLGYRYLWQAGSVAALSATGPAGGINKIEIGDRTDHEVRTSLRWAIK